jgi:signal transduction histidine kinase
VEGHHELELRVEDNGCGFDTAWVLEGDPQGMGIGLHSIAKRVDGTGGRLEIRSVRGRGTALAARWSLPLAS